MIALDTNVLIRFLVRDDEDQATRARTLVETCRARDDTCLVSNPVLCELEWVLESVYRATRSDIVAAVRMLQTTPPFVLEGADLLERVLQLYSKGSIARCPLKKRPAAISPPALPRAAAVPRVA